MTHDEMIEVITHHKNGGKVQVREINTPNWHNCNVFPCFNFANYVYRAKPEPLVAWIIYNQTSKSILTFCAKYQTPTELLLQYQRKFPDLQITLKKFVEVEE